MQSCAHIVHACQNLLTFCLVQYRLALIPSSEKMGLLKADFIHQVSGRNPAYQVDDLLAC